MTISPVVKLFVTKHLDALVAAIAGFFVVNLYMRYAGIGISPDSIMYMSTARNLNAHKGLLYFGDKPIVAFPVFFPLFLAAAQFITQTDPLPLGPYLIGLLFSAVIFLVGLLVENFAQPSKLYKWFILAAMVLSPSLLEIYSMLWSETLFIFWTMVFCFVARHYLLKPTLQRLLLLALLTAIACITRYAAVTLLGTGCLLMLTQPNLKLIEKIKHIVIYGLGSVSLLVINLIRNQLVTHTGTGPRYKSLTSLTENMHYTGTVLCDWFTLGEKYYGMATTLTFLVVTGSVVAFVYNWLKKPQHFTRLENILTAFFIVYALFMIISATISRYERLNNRLLSAMFIPLLLVGTYWIVTAVKLVAAKWRWVATTLALAIGMLFCYNEYSYDWKRYDDQGDYGVPGYTDDSWNKSELIKFMKRQPNLFKPGYPIFNNACEGFYFLTGKSAEYLPHKNDPKAIRKFYGLKRFYIVLFNQLPDPALITLEQIKQQRNLTTLFANADGGVYLYSQP